jgi:sterol 3beta-glucosyltransferase
MLAVLATYGTTGDVQPLLGLASELSLRGHRIRFAAPPDFGPRVTALGFDFVPLGPPIDLVELRSAHGRTCVNGDAVQFIRQTLPVVVRDTPQMVEDLSRACEGADMLISVPYQLAGRIVHDLTGITLVALFLSPFGGFGRRFADESARPINKLRARYSLPELDDPLGPMGSASMLGLHAVSPELIRRPRHWPAGHHTTGFFFFHEEWVPEPSLEEFIASGEPPVVICFGSMLHESPESLAETLLDAILRTGKRAVVQRGWTGLHEGAACSDKVRFVDFVPHSWLFAKAECVVHAGGAGTTASAVWAGVPSVVVPHLLDQFIWGALLRERDCASDVIPFGELTSERLASALVRAQSTSCQRSASELSTVIRLENGAARAADLIEMQVQ